MKNKILELKDSVWMLSQPSPMSQELRDLIDDDDAKDQEKLAAVNEWKASKYSVPLKKDAKAAQAIYDENNMKGNTLISATVFLPSGNGIINCRQPDTLEHFQIRF